MRLALALAFTLALASPAAATQEYTLPTLFDVTGVAADDVLNIRASPSASAPIIGRIAPNAKRVEVVDQRSGWMQVNTGEQAGWVNGRYLMYRVDVWEAGQLPPSLSCFGTEPFWSLTRSGGGMVLSRPDAGDRAMQLQRVLDTGVFRDPRRVIVADGLTAVMTPKWCSDGMSSRVYGLEATVVLGSGTGASMLSGCCSIASR
ncbi:SH3 domain-containing protein [Paracoccus sp. S-4012]|uniref:COG3650 family protein n=1 Tax=Paracoccus sp. S-4012 TaxID=2665648 RepID=UPI0012B01C98|nr:SH3 domain-containing protein [Paracoccus sp. S-4012]MRX50948.1 SH3 domain-containing protein [Paracoccus sp. S-4012]